MQPTDEIKSRLDLIDVISEYIQLKPAGANLKALCPFHTEKTASFMVSRARQIWHCFGCNVGGDMFSFVMRYEGVEFPEALRILSKKAGVALSVRDPLLHTKKTKLLDICELAAKFYRQVFERSSLAAKARVYIFETRKISHDMVDIFHLGFAPEVKGSSKNLNNFLLQHGFSQNDILDAGLVIKSKQGFGYFDRFRQRIMFPLFDLHGQVVGFTSRILTGMDDGMGKYVNTPQSMIYNKSELLYGFHLAKEAMRKNDLCVVVEGNMDVIALHQIEALNVVASSGTALTQEQIRHIKRFTDNLVLCFDFDVAGEQATERAVDAALREGMLVKIFSFAPKIAAWPLSTHPSELLARGLLNPYRVVLIVAIVASARARSRRAASRVLRPSPG